MTMHSQKLAPRSGLRPRGKPVFWTEDRKADVQAIWQKTQSYELIAESLGVSPGAVRAQVYNQGLRHIPPKEGSQSGKASKIRAVRAAALQTMGPALGAPDAPEPLSPKLAKSFAPEQAPDGALMLPFLELERNQCCWPFEGEAGSVFCGLPVVETGRREPYCAAHAAKAHQKPEPRRARRNYVVKSWRPL